MLKVDTYLSEQFSRYLKFGNIITIPNPLGMQNEYLKSKIDIKNDVPRVYRDKVQEMRDDLILYLKIAASVYDVYYADVCTVGDLAIVEISAIFVALNEFKIVSRLMKLINRIENDKRVRSENKKAVIEYLEENLGNIIYIGTLALGVCGTYKDVLDVPEFK